ncbi:MAG: HemK2/MTQ2 family protein methyltransferase [Candidatus Diapherotrites archaeon]
MTAYKRHMPRMSGEEAEKLRQFQEFVYETRGALKKEITMDAMGKKITVMHSVFFPIFSDTASLGKAVLKEVKKGDVVLDLGTGTGIQAILAAEKAEKVLAVDINPKAVECAKRNAELHGFSGKIEAIKSDVFSGIQGKKFDLIAFNPPFRWFRPRDISEYGSTDENYGALKRFFLEAKEHLNPKGKVLLVFSNTGDIEYLKELIRESGMKSEIVLENQEIDWRYYVVYRLTAQ